jgi:hypothetical protein
MEEAMLNARIVSAFGAFLFCTTISSDAPAAPFQPGDFITYSQDTWGAAPDPGTAALLLRDSFDALYPGGFEVGISGGAGFSMIFTSGPVLLAYLPGTGTPGPITSDLVDPTSTNSGMFGGLVAALQLNVDFTDAGLLLGSAGIPFGDLVLTNLFPQTLFNELSVRQYLAQANVFLSFDANNLPLYTYDELADLTINITRAFEGGTPSQFAQEHLRIGAQAVPEPATLTLLWLGIVALMVRRGRVLTPRRCSILLPSTQMSKH